jgi:hypothetical protein
MNVCWIFREFHGGGLVAPRRARSVGSFSSLKSPFKQNVAVCSVVLEGMSVAVCSVVYTRTTYHVEHLILHKVYSNNNIL